ncbi:hypothetical protein QJS10_CPA06g01780 [Acorus calamus]|uniref:Uncharacterized protein n=1 Tax=Acorus calamus TaxID=4465 RepID=A0AAV9EJ10_ACOCL|nr:hypothetical protein QJS10_CPA06g01780 [Acorus calamus]
MIRRRIITVESTDPLLKSTVRSVHFFSLTRFPPKNSNEERLKPPFLGDPVRRINGYDALLTECIDRRALDDGRGVHGHMIKAGFVPSLPSDEAHLVLCEMRFFNGRSQVVRRNA